MRNILCRNLFKMKTDCDWKREAAIDEMNKLRI